MTENLSTNSVFDRHYQDVDDRGNFVAVLYYFLPFPLFPFYITIVVFYMRYRVTFWEFKPCRWFTQHQAFLKALEAQVTLRNGLLGHGATYFDEIEVIDTLRHYLFRNLSDKRQKELALEKDITPLAEALNLAQSQMLWQNIALYLAEQDKSPLLLRGYESIQQHHNHAKQSERTESVGSLYIQQDTQQLELSPYLSARCCNLCGVQDVFIFNGCDKERRRFDLLEYMIGHRFKPVWYQCPDLHQEAGAYQPGNLDSTQLEISDLSRASMIALLDETSQEKRYLSPAYLRQPLHQFLTTQHKGIFWLQAPGHIGKSTFVQGLVGAEPLIADSSELKRFCRKVYPSALESANFSKIE